MGQNKYKSPVNELLLIGDIRGTSEWLNYSNFGITDKDIPELVEMATDSSLNFGDPNSSYVWAPLHAWRALGQLRAIQAIEPLINLFHELRDDTWANEDLPGVFGIIGKEALPYLSRYLLNKLDDDFPKITCAESIKQIGIKDEKTRHLCIQALTKELEKYLDNSPALNAFYIWYLKDLGAKDKLPLIKKVYTDNKVDEQVIGSYEKLEAKLLLF